MTNSEQQLVSRRTFAGLASSAALAGCTSIGSSSPATDAATATSVGREVDGIQFSVRSGPDAPNYWTYPVTVEFRRYTSDGWEARHIAKVSENQPFVVNLDKSKSYQIAVIDDSGNSRILGRYDAGYANSPVELVIWPCCKDSFDRGGSSE